MRNGQKVPNLPSHDANMGEKWKMMCTNVKQQLIIETYISHLTMQHVTYVSTIISSCHKNEKGILPWLRRNKLSVGANKESTPIVYIHPLLEFFSTEMFDPSIKSIEDLEMLAQIVGNADSIFMYSIKGAPLVFLFFWKNLYIQFMTKNKQFFQKNKKTKGAPFIDVFLIDSLDHCT